MELSYWIFLQQEIKPAKLNKTLVGAVVINISVFSPVIKGETNQCDPFLFWDKTYRSVVTIVLRRKKSGLCIKSHIALVAGSHLACHCPTLIPKKGRLMALSGADLVHTDSSREYAVPGCPNLGRPQLYLPNDHAA